MDQGMIYLLIASMAFNAFLLIIMAYTKLRDLQVHRNKKVLREWLKVHLALQKANQSTLEIKRIDSSSILYWGTDSE